MRFLRSVEIVLLLNRQRSVGIRANFGTESLKDSGNTRRRKGAQHGRDKLL